MRNSSRVGRLESLASDLLAVSVETCGLLALYDPARDRWHDISRRDFSGFGFELVAAEPVVLMLGRNADTDEERMLAYRPPSR